jgi:hypothetical protein
LPADKPSISFGAFSGAISSWDKISQVAGFWASGTPPLDRGGASEVALRNAYLAWWREHDAQPIDAAVVSTALPSRPAGNTFWAALRRLQDNGAFGDWGALLHQLTLTIQPPGSNLQAWRHGVGKAVQAFEGPGPCREPAVAALAPLLMLDDAALKDAFVDGEITRTVAWRLGVSPPDLPNWVTAEPSTETPVALALVALPTDSDLEAFISKVDAGTALVENKDEIKALVFGMARQQLFDGTPVLKLRVSRGLADPRTGKIPARPRVRGWNE